MRFVKEGPRSEKRPADRDTHTIEVEPESTNAGHKPPRLNGDVQDIRGVETGGTAVGAIVARHRKDAGTNGRANSGASNAPLSIQRTVIRT